MYGLWCNESSVSELLQSLNDNLLTRLYGAHTNFVIAADNSHLMASLRLRNGTLR